MTNISLNKSLFVDKFLFPILKIADKGTITIYKDYIDFSSCSSDNVQTIIFYSKLNYVSAIDTDKIELSIPSIKRLYALLNSISGNEINLSIDSNSLSYNDGTFSFKYHLYYSTLSSGVDINKISNIKFDTKFNVSKQFILTILKSASFISDLVTSKESEKVYLYTKDNKINVDITDKSISNMDNISLFLDNKDNSVVIQTPIILNLYIFKLISSLSFDTLNVKINTQKSIVEFNIEDKDIYTKYLLSSKIQ